MKKDRWKEEARTNPDNWSPENLERMRGGDSPLEPDGTPYEFHHVQPLQYGGSNDFDNLRPMTAEDHRLGGNMRGNHPRPGDPGFGG